MNGAATGFQAPKPFRLERNTMSGTVISYATLTRSWTASNGGFMASDFIQKSPGCDHWKCHETLPIKTGASWCFNRGSLSRNKMQFLLYVILKVLKPLLNSTSDTTQPIPPCKKPSKLLTTTRVSQETVGEPGCPLLLCICDVEVIIALLCTWLKVSQLHTRFPTSI